MSRRKIILEERDGELVPIVKWGIDPSKEIFDTREEYELDRECREEARSKMGEVS